MLVALATTGCWPMVIEQNHGTVSPTTLLPVRPAPPVTPEEVTETNASEKAKALREEMEQAQHEPPPGAVSEGTGAAKPGR
jgi:hypothetical protein